MDQLAALRLFVHISKSIAAAGRSLGLSTTTASKRLQDLESVLNVSLVDRTTRQLALTEAGERLMSRSAGLLDELQTAFLEAKESPGLLIAASAAATTPGRADRAYVTRRDDERTAKTAPCGSRACTIKSAPGVSIEQLRMTSPRFAIRFAAVSMSSTVT
jgi:DNA-binding transcriptional LysR family regulator